MKNFKLFKIRLLIVTVLMSIAVGGFTQNQYLSYYHNINIAELKICENKYQSAFLHYKKGFKLDTRIYTKDLYNAYLVCLHLKKFKYIKSYYHQLILRGIDPSRLEDLPANISFSSKKWKRLKNKYKGFKPVFDNSCTQYLDSLRFLDQHIRKYCADKLGFMYDPSCLDTIQYVDSLNLQQLKLLFKAYGFWFEDKIRIKSILDNIPYDLVIRHNLAHKKDSNIPDLLLGAVKVGELHPAYYAFWIDNWLSSHHLKARFQSEHLGTQNALKINQELFLFIEANEEETNRRRGNIYLCSLSNFRTKMLFQLKNPKFQFIHSVLYPSFDWGNDLINNVLTGAKEKGEKVIRINLEKH